MLSLDNQDLSSEFFFPLAATRHKNSFENSKDATEGWAVGQWCGWIEHGFNWRPWSWKNQWTGGYCHPWREKHLRISRIPQKGHFHSRSTLAEQSFLVSDRVVSKPSCRSPVNGTLLNLQKCIEFQTMMRLTTPSLSPSYCAAIGSDRKESCHGDASKNHSFGIWCSKPASGGPSFQLWEFWVGGTGKLCRAMPMSGSPWPWVEKVFLKMSC